MAHTDEEKRIALLTLQSCKGDYSKTAIMCKEFYGIDISREGIRLWAKGEHIDKTVQENLQEDKRELSDKLETIANNMLDRVNSADLSDASPVQLMTSAAIAIDKMLLLRGQATSISSTDVGSNDARLRLMEMFLRYGKAEQDANNPDQ